MRYAVVKEGVVENVIEWDGEEMLPGLGGADFIRSDTAGIGYLYVNGAFEDPDPAPVSELTPPEGAEENVLPDGAEGEA